MRRPQAGRRMTDALRGLLNHRLSAHAAIVKRDWGALQPLLLRRINLKIQGQLGAEVAHAHLAAVRVGAGGHQDPPSWAVLHLIAGRRQSLNRGPQHNTLPDDLWATWSNGASPARLHLETTSSTMALCRTTIPQRRARPRPSIRGQLLFSSSASITMMPLGPRR